MKYALFDMDGVLLDSERGSFAIVQNSLEQIGISEPVDDLMERYVGMTPRAIGEDIIRRHRKNIPVEDFLSIHLNRGSYYEVCEDLRPTEGLVDFLEFLRERKVRMAVVSSTPSRNVLIALNRMKILSYFEAVVCGDTLSTSKPSPEGYLKAAEYLGAEPSECMVIEDSKAGVQAGKNAGMFVAAYKETSPGQDTSGADLEVFSFRELEEALTRNPEFRIC